MPSSFLGKSWIYIEDVINTFSVKVQVSLIRVLLVYKKKLFCFEIRHKKRERKLVAKFILTNRVMQFYKVQCVQYKDLFVD